MKTVVEDNALAHERSVVALVRVSAEGDGAEVPTRKKQRHPPLLKQAFQNKLSFTKSAAA